MKIIKIKDPVYKQNIMVVVNCTEKELEKYILKHYGCSGITDNACVGKCFAINDDDEATACNVIWLEKFDDKIDNQGYMAHELIHCAVNIISKHGINFEAHDSEALAYYYEFLFREVWTKLKPKKKKK